MKEIQTGKTQKDQTGTLTITDELVQQGNRTQKLRKSAAPL